MKKRVILFTLNCLLASLLLVCFVGTVANNQAINNVQPTGSYRDESDGNTTLLLDTGKIVNMRFCSSAVKISSSYVYQTKEEIFEIVLFIRFYAEQNGYTVSRSNTDLYGEFRLHNILYDMGFYRSYTADADLDYVEDPRWYINAASKLVGWSGL